MHDALSKPLHEEAPETLDRHKLSIFFGRASHVLVRRCEVHHTPDPALLLNARVSQGVAVLSHSLANYGLVIL